MRKQTYTALCYRLFFLIAASYILFYNVTNNLQIDMSFNFYVLWYYPQWNLLVTALAYLYLICRMVFSKRDQEISLPLPLRGMIATSMLLCMVYFLFIKWPFLLYLKPAMQEWLLYVGLPVLLYLDWILFDKKKRIRFISVILWLAEPVSYFLLVLIRAQYKTELTPYSTNYIYPLLDVQRLGLLQVGKNVFLLLTVWFICGAMLYGVSQIKKKQNKVSL